MCQCRSHLQEQTNGEWLSRNDRVRVREQLGFYQLAALINLAARSFTEAEGENENEKCSKKIFHAAHSIP